MRATAAVIAVLVTACSSEPSGPPPPPPPPPAPTVATVTVESPVTSVTVGGTVQLTATARTAQNATVAGKTFTWAVTPDTRATISSSGLLTAVLAGDVTVTASVDGKSGQATLTITQVPVATVTVTAPATSVLAGGTLQLTATTKDAQGATLNGRTVTWTATPAGRATVAANGLLTAVTPGDVTVTATSETVTGQIALSVVDPRNIPFFSSKPFPGEFPTGNFMDHNIPKEFVDVNGDFLTHWGELLPVQDNLVDGHSGYDWMMPTGTALLAVGSGRVARVITSNPPFFCPPLNANVTDQHSVFLEHTLPGGVKVQSWYVHLSRIDVAVGQTVAAGEQIGLAGNTGCSTAPHLHFEMFRVMPNNSLRTFDAYGWNGVGTDPWEAHQDGTASINLWQSGAAPTLWREKVFNFTPNPFHPVVMTKLVYAGVNDGANPNNEYVELTLDTRLAATISLNGYGIRPLGNPALDFRLPNGLTLTAAQPTVRVYTGTGTNSGLTVYMGRNAPIWPNHRSNGCLNVLYPVGMSATYFVCQ